MSYSKQFARKVRLAEVTHSQLAQSAVSGGNWANLPTPWTDVDAFIPTAGGVVKGTFVVGKRGTPVDGTLNTVLSTVVEGRVGPGHAPQTITTTPLADLIETDTGTDPANAGNPHSSDTLVSQNVFPQMRVLFSGYTQTDAVNSIVRSTVANGIIYHPPGLSADAAERMQLYLPTVDPIRARNATLGKKYPVLIYMRPSATPYITSAALASGAITEGTGNDVIPWNAVARGWAVLDVRSLGIDTALSGTECFWKATRDLSIATEMDPAKAITWIVEWIRSRGVDLYQLDPDRIVVCGFKDGASHALFQAYTPLALGPVSGSTNLQLSKPGVPNAVIALDPDVEWSTMATALACPLRNDDSTTTATGTILAGFGDGSSSDVYTLSTGFSLTPAHLMFLKSLTDAQRETFASIPAYISAGLTANDIGSRPVGWVDGNTVFDRLPDSALGAVAGGGLVANQFGAHHGFRMISTIREYVRLNGVSDSLLAKSVLNHAGTAPTAASALALVNRTNTTLKTILLDALDWVEPLLEAERRTPGVEPRYFVDCIY